MTNIVHLSTNDLSKLQIKASQFDGRRFIYIDIETLSVFLPVTDCASHARRLAAALLAAADEVEAAKTEERPA